MCVPLHTHYMLMPLSTSTHSLKRLTGQQDEEQNKIKVTMPNKNSHSLGTMPNKITNSNPTMKRSFKHLFKTYVTFNNLHRWIYFFLYHLQRTNMNAQEEIYYSIKIPWMSLNAWDPTCNTLILPKFNAFKHYILKDFVLVPLYHHFYLHVII